MTSYKNRGKALEQLIEMANKQYKAKGLAIVTKVPVEKGFNKKQGYQFYKEASTVDFVGISIHKFGRMIAFDAKGTKQKSLPFSNIKAHQIEYLQNIKKHGGHAFFVVRFDFCDEIYVVDVDDVVTLMERDERKSIPYSYFKDMAERVESKNGIVLDYLSIGGCT